jgi:hypothetical protein
MCYDFNKFQSCTFSNIGQLEDNKNSMGQTLVFLWRQPKKLQNSSRMKLQKTAHQTAHRLTETTRTEKAVTVTPSRISAAGPGH